MFVNDHAIERVRSRVLDQRLAAQLIAKLEAVPGVPGAVAYEVHRWADAIVSLRDYPGFESNGDQLVAIVRDGTVETIMLRRSWNQPFTRSALGVDRVVRLVTIPSATA